MLLHILLHVDVHFAARNHLGAPSVTKPALHFDEGTLFPQMPVDSTVLDSSFAALAGHGVLLASLGAVGDDGLAVGVVVGGNLLVGSLVVAVPTAVRAFAALLLVFLQFFPGNSQPASLWAAELHVPAVSSEVTLDVLQHSDPWALVFQRLYEEFCCLASAQGAPHCEGIDPIQEMAIYVHVSRKVFQIALWARSALVFRVLDAVSAEVVSAGGCIRLPHHLLALATLAGGIYVFYKVSSVALHTHSVCCRHAFHSDTLYTSLR